MLGKHAKNGAVRRHRQQQGCAALEAGCHAISSEGYGHACKPFARTRFQCLWGTLALVCITKTPEPITIIKDMRSTMTDLNTLLKNYIRDIPNFPIPGIMFRDITTLLADSEAFKLAIDGLLEPYRDQRIDKIVVIESRGFIFGSPMAYELGAGVVPVRKPGKLPGDTVTEEYSLEYGTNTLQLHTDAILEGDRVIIVDDLLATGGTVDATIKLVKSQGAEILGVSFLAELMDLNGRDRIIDVPIHSLVRYE